MSSRPGILFVLNSLTAGGSETKIIRVANSLSQLGVDVQLAYLNPPETFLTRIDPSLPVTNLHRRGKYSVSCLKRLRKLVDREDLTVVAVNLYPLLYVVPAAKLQHQRHVKIVGLVNTAELVGGKRFLANVYRPFLKRCDQLVFGCTAQRRLWLREYTLSAERTRVIYNGVDPTFYSPTSGERSGGLFRQQLGIPDGAFTIGSIGRLAPEKSFHLLVRALADLNQTGRLAYAVLVGQGAERKNLEQLAVAQGVGDKIRFLGLQEDVRPAIYIMDVFVLPSSAVETFSNAALEAMAMARAVVLSDMGGATEMVEHGRSGMVFPVGDIDALTEILVMLYDSDDLRKRLGSAARERVVRSFGFSNMVAEYRKLLPSG